MATSILTHQHRALERLSLLADHVRCNGTGSEIVDTDRLLRLVALGSVNARDAHSILASVRRHQQARAAA